MSRKPTRPLAAAVDAGTPPTPRQNVPALALDVASACAALGVSWDTWRAHVEPDVRIVRLGRRTDDDRTTPGSPHHDLPEGLTIADAEAIAQEFTDTDREAIG